VAGHEQIARARQAQHRLDLPAARMHQVLERRIIPTETSRESERSRSHGNT
jgi:hypothetical protein